MDFVRIRCLLAILCFGISLTGRAVAVGLAMAAVLHHARRLDADAWRAWLWEAWRFVKQIFVLLVVGVFVVGIVRQLIQPEWIQNLAGRNDWAVSSPKRNTRFNELRMKACESWPRSARTFRAGYASCVWRAVGC